jgi:biopolymer transport protein ExbD
MPACTSSWQTYGCECGVTCLWQSMGLLRRLDVIALALMLMRVIAVLGHVAYRQHSIRRSTAADANSRKIFAAELSQRLYVLTSIAHTAPFLGLVGACIGIFDSFVGLGMQKAAGQAIITQNLSRAPITIAAAVLVSVPAICSFNYLQRLLNLLKLEISWGAHEAIPQPERCVGVAQSLPLQKQFSRLPSSAVTVAPCLALVIAGFITFSPFDISRGLDVGLLGPGGRSSQIQYFTTDPVAVAVAVGADGSPVLYVDSKKTSWDELRTTIQDELKLRSRHVVYLAAEDGVRWMDVMNVIDVVELDATVVLSTIAPDRESLRSSR